MCGGVAWFDPKDEEDDDDMLVDIGGDIFRTVLENPIEDDNWRREKKEKETRVLVKVERKHTKHKHGAEMNYYLNTLM